MHKTIKFDNLSSSNFFEIDELTVIKDNVNFNFRLNILNNYSSVVVFSNGAIDRSTKQPPIYQRVSWKEEIEASTIYVDDPTLHKGDMNIGWGIGEEKHYYLNTISEILKIILSKVNIIPKNTTYFGSSAGGTMSMILASMNKGSKAIVNNPQTRVEHFFSGNQLRKIIATYFSNYTEEEFINKFKDRISVVEAFVRIGHCPQILYIINRKSHFDMSIDYKFFIEDIERNKLSLETINFIMYSNEKKGHNPISKENTINIINNFSNNTNLWIN